MGRHGGENIASVLDVDLQQKLHLEEKMPKWGVSDNASNMVRGIGMSVLELYTCNCHTQQLAIEDCFKSFRDNGEDETMLDKITKCQKLAAHLKRADTSRKLLHAECEVVGHRPNQIPVANDTRWDSTYSCMSGVLYHETCLLNMARKGHLRFENTEGVLNDLIPSINDFRMIEAAVEVLEKCKTTTKIFEQEKIPTVPLVVERLYTVDQELDEFINDDVNKRTKKKAVKFASVLKETLSVRFPDYGTDRMINCIANFLNPALKGCHLKVVNKLDQTLTEMEEHLIEWQIVLDEGSAAEEVNNSRDSTDSPPAKLSVTELLKRRLRAEEEEKANRPAGRKRGRSAVFALHPENTQFQARLIFMQQITF